MCSPGLVARLMGLDTMPADAARERPRRALDSACSAPENSADSRQDLNLEIGTRMMTAEARPQKLRKTGDAAQFGKRKLASPVKSPRTRGSARLTEVAARILEPGLQRRSRARYALTYHGPARGNAGCSESELPPPPWKPDESLCGSLVEVAELEPEREGVEIGKRSPSSREFDNVGKLKVGAGEERHGSEATPSWELDNVGKLKGTSRAGEVKAYAAIVQGKVNAFTRSDELASNHRGAGGAKEGLPSRGANRQSKIRQNQKMTVRDKPAVRRDVSIRQRTRRGLTSASSSVAQGLVAASRKPDLPARKRTASHSSASAGVKPETCLCERKAMMGRRSRPNDESRISISTRPKPYVTSQINVRPQNVVPARVAAPASTSSVAKNHQRNNVRKPAISRGTHAVSFTFKAQLRHGEELLYSEDNGKDTRSLSDPLKEHGAHHRESIADSSAESLPSRMVTTLTSDELAALLEQKIRELNSLHRAAVDGENVNRSTASILEELISALAKGGPLRRKEADSCKSGVGPKEGNSYGSPSPREADANSRKVDAQGISPVLCPELECNQPSPVSILEASFSAGSTTSESIFSTSGLELSSELEEESWGKSQPWDPYSDFLDPAAFKKVSLSLGYISLMYGTRGCFGFSKVSPNFAGEVILNTEMFIRCSAGDIDCGLTAESPIDALLLGILDSLCSEFDRNPELASSPAVMNVTHPDQDSLRRFLFDCIIEKLDKINKLWRSCFMSAKKLPQVLCDKQKLMGEIRDDISKCRNSAGRSFDEIINMELKQLTDKWVEFEDEAFEAGIDIENDLFQALVDEMALDLLPR